MDSFINKIIRRLVRLVPVEKLAGLIAGLARDRVKSMAPDESLRMLLRLDQDLYELTGSLAAAYGQGRREGVGELRHPGAVGHFRLAAPGKLVLGRTRRGLCRVHGSGPHQAPPQGRSLVRRRGISGGGAALYHGIKYKCDGVYVMCPRVDLAAKIAEEKANDAEGPYAHLQGGSKDVVPELLGLAESQEKLPPMFLVQNQFDHVNPFAEHGFKLLDVYNRKKGWCGLRVYPAIGHGGDGARDEAKLFFGHILDKAPL